MKINGGVFHREVLLNRFLEMILGNSRFRNTMKVIRLQKMLTFAGKEIDLLSQDIEQEKRKKKALMQLLLTGIVRVNV